MRPSRGLWCVLIAAAGFVLLYVYLDVRKLHALHYDVDEGIFLQSLVNFARSGSTFDWVEGRPHLTVHDSWALLALAPLMRAFPRTETLIVVQVLAIAGAAIVLYFLARSFGLGDVPSTLVALAYLVSPSVQGWAYDNFYENHFVPLVAFGLALAVRKRAFWPAIVLAQILLGLKEDQIFFLAWFGIAGALWYDRRLGIAVAALALLNGVAYYGIVHALGFAPNHPGYTFDDVQWPQQLAFLAEVLAPFAFAPVTLGARVLLAAPLVAEITLNQTWGTPLARAGAHSTEPLVALIAIGAVAAIARRPRLARYALGCSFVMALFFNTTVLHIGRHVPAPDETDFERARVVAQDDEIHVYTLAEHGEFAVAASNPNVRLR